MPLYYLLALAVGGEIIDLVGETGPVAKIVLLILLIFSLISWAIILSKWSVLRRTRVQRGRVLRAFCTAERVADVGGLEGRIPSRTLGGGVSGGFLAKTAAGEASDSLIGGSIREFAARGDDFSLEMLNAVERQQAVYREPSEVRR